MGRPPCAAEPLALLYDMATHHGDSDGRRFTDREMRLIFERAGEADVGAQGDRGYSLAEIQEIALQVGLSPTDVARAASTISSSQASYPVLGGPIRFSTPRVRLHFRLRSPVFAEVSRSDGVSWRTARRTWRCLVASAVGDGPHRRRLHGEGHRNPHRSDGCSRRRGGPSRQSGWLLPRLTGCPASALERCISTACRHRHRRQSHRSPARRRHTTLMVARGAPLGEKDGALMKTISEAASDPPTIWTGASILEHSFEKARSRPRRHTWCTSNSAARDIRYRGHRPRRSRQRPPMVTESS